MRRKIPQVGRDKKGKYFRLHATQERLSTPPVNGAKEESASHLSGVAVLVASGQSSLASILATDRLPLEIHLFERPSNAKRARSASASDAGLARQIKFRVSPYFRAEKQTHA
jgi:hypothetical protein